MIQGVEKGSLLTQLKFWWCPSQAMWLDIASSNKLDLSFEWIMHA